MIFDSRNYYQYLRCFISESQIKSPEEISLDGFEQVYLSYCDSAFSFLHFQFEVQLNFSAFNNFVYNDLFSSLRQQHLSAGSPK